MSTDSRRSGSPDGPTRAGRRRRVDTTGREGYNRAVTRHTFLNDIVFKLVFGSEDSAPLLRSLTNALLGLSGPDRITEIQILNPSIDKRYRDDKGSILDVKARDSTGRLLNIELQVCNHLAYVPRALYYLARLFGGQGAPGEGYEQLGKTIGISLLDFNLFPDRADLHSTYHFHDAVHGHRLTDLMEMHFIELVKFRDDKPRALMTPFEKWLHVLKFGELYERGDAPLPRELENEEGIVMAIDRLRRAWADDDLREYIESREKARMDEVSRLHHARNEGKAEGRAEGKAEGKAEGRAEGKAEGRAEGVRDAARRMLETGMDRETVCRVLDLAPEDLA